jgi:hypothetical protein
MDCGQRVVLDHPVMAIDCGEGMVMNHGVVGTVPSKAGGIVLLNSARIDPSQRRTNEERGETARAL